MEVRLRGVLITAVLCLASGIGVLFGFCHGNTGIQFAYPLSAASVQVHMTTTGIPAILGLMLAVSGAFLLIVATAIAVIEMVRRNAETQPVRRRESAFDE